MSKYYAKRSDCLALGTNVASVSAQYTLIAAFFSNYQRKIKQAAMASH
jgi:hypothetical protein